MAEQSLFTLEASSGRVNQGGWLVHYALLRPGLPPLYTLPNQTLFRHHVSYACEAVIGHMPQNPRFPSPVKLSKFLILPFDSVCLSVSEWGEHISSGNLIVFMRLSYPQTGILSASSLHSSKGVCSCYYFPGLLNPG